MRHKSRIRLSLSGTAIACTMAMAAVLTTPAAGEKPASVSGQVSLSVDGRQKFAAGARVYWLGDRPSQFSYTEKTTTTRVNDRQSTRVKSDKDAVLAEWNGFWPAMFYHKDWNERLFAPLRDKNRQTQDTEEYMKAMEEKRLPEYTKQRDERRCRDKADAVDYALAATLQEAQREKKENLIVSTTADDSGKYTLANVPPGRFALVFRARIEPDEVHWFKDGEVKAGKSVVINAPDPIFSCKTPALERK